MRSNRKLQFRPDTVIRGVAAYAEWMDEGRDAQVVLLTDEDEEFYIECRDGSIDPTSFVNCRVEAVGRLLSRDDRTILIARYMRSVDFEDDDDEDADIGYDESGFDDDFGTFNRPDLEYLDGYARSVKG